MRLRICFKILPFHLNARNVIYECRGSRTSPWIIYFIDVSRITRIGRYLFSFPVSSFSYTFSSSLLSSLFRWGSKATTHQGNPHLITWIMKLRNSIFMKKAAQSPPVSAILNENNRFALSPLLIRFLSMIILPARVSRSYNSDILSAKLKSRLRISGMS